ncbi:MAG: hypothetical protein AB1531_12660 [Chloroflexota bacterium]
MVNKTLTSVVLFFLLPSCTANVQPTSPTVSAIPNVCPVIESNVTPPPFDLETIDFLNPDERNSIIVDYLNLYGIGSPILENQTPHFVIIDLTTDTNPEIIYDAWLGETFTIFGCQQGEYSILLDIEAYATRSQLEFIADLNQNGFPEIAFNMGYLSQGGHSYKIIEWDGSRFQDIFPDGNREINATGTLSYGDNDGDGIQELIVNSGIYTWGDLAWNFGPWRNVTSIYEWNGSQYYLAQEEWNPPEYRFQAVQDADRLFLVGKYEEALVLYQQAITSDSLEWWTPELRRYADLVRDSAYTQATLPPPPEEDKNEYVALSAYSYFRMMLVYLIEDQPTFANDIYQAIQTQYNNEPFGKPYLEMATVLWEEYSAQQNIVSACQSAIAFVENHQNEILTYLGNTSYELASSTFHGVQSLEYKPKSICPIK